MMAQLSDLTRPVVRAGTGFHRNDAPRLRCYETEKLRASDALAEQHMPGSIRSMQVEHVFRDVQTDRGSLLHGRLLRWQFDTATLAHRCRQGASTPSSMCGRARLSSDVSEIKLAFRILRSGRRRISRRAARGAVAMSWDMDADSAFNWYNKDTDDNLVAAQSWTHYDPLIAISRLAKQFAAPE